MLFYHPNLNPAVRSEAELLTDGIVTDAILRDAATMRGLPLMVELPAYTGPSAPTLAERETVAAEAELRIAQRCLAGACRELGEANRRTLPPSWSGGKPTVLSPVRVRQRKADAMQFINSRRAQVRAAQKRLSTARAVLLALAS